MGNSELNKVDRAIIKICLYGHYNDGEELRIRSKDLREALKSIFKERQDSSLSQNNDLIKALEAAEDVIGDIKGASKKQIRAYDKVRAALTKAKGE